VDTAIRMESTDLNLAAVERALAEDPNAFDFFQAVRLLERLRAGGALGGHGDPAEEPVHFGAHIGLAFPASEIQTLELADEGPAHMRVNFMGLTGPSGVLPYHYTQLLIERAQAKDHALADFQDIFHHRLISLLYRAWLKHRFDVSHERGEEYGLLDHLLDLGGLGLAADRRHAPVAEEALATRAGLFAPEPRSAIGLERLLADYFDVPVTVEQFVGGWYRVEHADRCALDEPVQASRLGRGALVGDEVWDAQARARIRVGPLDRATFERFLPAGDAYRTLGGLARLYANDQFDFEIQLILQKDDVPGCALDPAQGTRLGWSTWVRTASRDRDAEDTVLAV
jgi:type VI secretion system protein ImpH